MWIFRPVLWSSSAYPVYMVLALLLPGLLVPGSDVSDEGNPFPKKRGRELVNALEHGLSFGNEFTSSLPERRRYTTVLEQTGTF